MNGFCCLYDLPVDGGEICPIDKDWTCSDCIFFEELARPSGEPLEED